MAWTCGRSRKLKKSIVNANEKYIYSLDKMEFVLNQIDSDSKLCLDIGFGTGDSVLESLKNGYQVIGCEIFKPAIFQTLSKLDNSADEFNINSNNNLMKKVHLNKLIEEKYLNNLTENKISEIDGVNESEVNNVIMSGVNNRKLSDPKSSTFLFLSFIDDLMKYMPNQIFDKITMFFPDPWPKYKHRMRRCYNIPNLDLKIFRLLKDNGEFILASDIKYIADNMKNLFSNPFFNIDSNEYTDYESCPYKTNYCRKGFAAGRNVYDMQVRKSYIEHNNYNVEQNHINNLNVCCNVEQSNMKRNDSNSLNIENIK